MNSVRKKRAKVLDVDDWGVVGEATPLSPMGEGLTDR